MRHRDQHFYPLSLTHVMAVIAILMFSTVAYAADPSGTGAAKPGGATESGTIEGEVKKVDPSVVIIEKETSGKDSGKEVRLPLNESTHKGDVKEGDKVEAFVTPGGTTTSVQPKKGGLNR
jgi:Cu/Ag efflux protein CusF